MIKAHSRKPARKLADEVTVGRRLKTRKPQSKPRGEPRNVLDLIARFTGRQ